MKVIVFAICYNQAKILPWFLRHYSSFADEISVFDDKSDDGSRALLSKCRKVLLRDWPYGTGIDEDRFLQFAYEWYPKAHPAFDWVMWVDCDEFIYAPNIREVLQKNSEYELIRPVGYNMVGNGLPQDDGRQIYEVLKTGVDAPVYSKPVVFKPSSTVRWVRGKHDIENCSPIVSPNRGLKLLHYRFLGEEYTRMINAKNYSRCGLISGDKGAAWSCSPQYTGEHSAQWAERVKNYGTNVVDL